MFEWAATAAGRTSMPKRRSYTRSTRQSIQLALLDNRELLLSLHAVQPDPLENHGEIFTRRWVVELILDLVGYDPAEDLSDLLIVEPACGHGAFLLPLVERLVKSCEKHDRQISGASKAIRAYDLLPVNVEAARVAVTQLLKAHDVDMPTATRLAKAWITQGDFLLQTHDETAADFVVGNPPYIRLEDVPEARSNAYRSACPTMGGRADIFVGFYERGLRCLKPGGRLGYICADRWMRNAYGKDIRALVAAEYAVEAAISMHDVDAFEEQVAAYPAVTVIRSGEQGPAVIADTNARFGERDATLLAGWFRAGPGDPLHSEAISAAWLGHWFTTQAGWPTGSPDRLALVADLEERFPLLEDTGAKVGIGLASGADQIYVTDDASVAERERMLPMVMRGDLQSGEVRWSRHYLVNPWAADGLVDLTKWPRMAAYLRGHWQTLAGRNVGKRNPGREHRTIDRVIEGLQTRRKLLLADMSSRIWPVLDEGEYYPHHNLYWIHENDSNWDLEVLGGLLLSDIAELFISTYCVRMRGGTLRFQAQYLRRIRVPRFETISPDDRECLRVAFKARDTAAATEIALRLYGVESVPD
ncbi:Eco57I restriction-modification methylase domain-containing protein [Paractinoplanes durhamensis]|uniref:site-specific DNA-methyltransferase (adenine-specific) n=1 Tax=Paractinoplanes durhamensis TaxID=113563 RepID=A0ABQ3Z3X9_9ACTN|nr:N-6 DNA methylase [Actinoplanes durhamensis]GIE04545.1 type II DNA modification methyltransferase [Actinoplanes durhamensis]